MRPLIGLKIGDLVEGKLINDFFCGSNSQGFKSHLKFELCSTKNVIFIAQYSPDRLILDQKIEEWMLSNVLTYFNLSNRV